ncbi:MAG: CDP-diacylglycerol--glycerol-3-phosphate 3-phosphatidyltransferase [Actinobacteria bacterium]|nr:CDP-diacylglycerol--glycerol-3-phosphate 3-phosphatidyltransferase [Actinomycetota bacterium]
MGGFAIRRQHLILGLGWPNLISVGRILLVPLLVALVLSEDRGAAYAAAAIFLAGALSDGLDGYLARRYGTRTRTGEWLDPLADKVFVAAPLVALSALGRFPVWVAVVILVREVGVTLLRTMLGRRGIAMPASNLAKWKTSFQLVAITLYLLPLASGWTPVRLGVLTVALGLTIWTGIDYLIRAMRFRGVAPAPYEEKRL